MHSWEMLAKIIDHPDCQDIICDVGMPVRCVSVRKYLHSRLTMRKASQYPI